MAFDLSKAAYGKASVSNLDKIKMIPLDQIQGNQQNFYSIEKIDELAETIEMVGLMHPISVVADGEKYRVISGHRRFKAYEKLYLDNLPDQKYARIPAMVMKDLDDLSETLALITANATARELTYSEKCQQERVLRETLQAMKAAGKEVPSCLGQYIADQIGVSRNEVSRMHSVNENLIPEARAKLDAGEMTAQQAYEMSRRPKEEQLTLYSGAYEASVIQSNLSREHEVLMQYVKANGRYLSQCAGQGTVYTRQDGTDNLRLSNRNSGGYDGKYHYDFSNKCVRLGIEGVRLTLSWTTLWDSLAIYAIEQLAKAPIQIESRKTAATAWKTGVPTTDGEYACRFRSHPASIVTRRILYWYNGCWNLFNTEDGCPINEAAEVLGWILLPEDRTED